MARKKKFLGEKFYRGRKKVQRSFRNKISVFAAPILYLKSVRTLNAYRESLSRLTHEVLLKEGTGFLHFVYGFKNKHEFPLYAYLAVRSAQLHNPDWPVCLHYIHEPTGEWWTRLREDSRINFIPLSDFNFFNTGRLYHYAHKADVVRLLALHDMGGVYLDSDTITRRSFAALLKDDFGMAVQAAVNNSAAGLCNAVMWGKRHAVFSRTWLKQYRYFYSKGRDSNWDFHSVRLPWILLGQYSRHINVLGYRAFFTPLWVDVENVLFSEDGERFNQDLSQSYAFHLWNNAIEERLLSLNMSYIKTSKSIYASLARPVVEAYP